MKEQIIRILEIIAGIASLVLMFGVPLGCLYITKRRTSKIPAMSSEELKKMASKQPALYCNDIIKELISRGEDISFAMPLFLKMVCSKNLLNRLIGWQGLKIYFSEKLTEIDFSEARPSKNTLVQLRSIESKFCNNSGL
jgi:hypothetical protein